MISPLAWIVTIVVVLALCAVEVAVALRRPAAPSLRAAVLWSLAYVALAAAFGAVLGMVGGWELGEEYLGGFVVEKSLSIDNLFVFVIIIAAFGVPQAQRSRALTSGILAALALRCLFIALGAALIAEFSVTFAVFGAILVFTSVQLLRHRGQDAQVHGVGAVTGVLGRFLPLSERYDGGRLITRAAGRRAATPLLVVLVVMGATDALFALDSIPAVFGVTDRPFIVFAANAFALLGMRPLFFLVSGLVTRLVYLSEGMAAILCFIGLKLILEFVGEHVAGLPQIGTGLTLAVIAAILALAALASLIRGRRGVVAPPAEMRPRPHGETPHPKRSSVMSPLRERKLSS